MLLNLDHHDGDYSALGISIFQFSRKFPRNPIALYLFACKIPHLHVIFLTFSVLSLEFQTLLGTYSGPLSSMRPQHSILPTGGTFQMLVSEETDTDVTV